MAREWDIEMDGSGNFTVIQHHLLRIFDGAYAKEHLRPFRMSFWSQSQRFRPLALRIWNEERSYRAVEPDKVAEGPSEIARKHPSYEVLRDVTIDFGDVKAGEIVELIFQWDYAIIPGEYNTRWFIHEFGDELPTIEEQLTLRLPSAFDPDFGQTEPEIKQITRPLGGIREHSWLTGHLSSTGTPMIDAPVSRIHEGDLASDRISRVAFTTANWEYLSTYLGRYWKFHAAKTGNRLNAEVSRLIADVRDQRERLDRVVAYMQEEIDTLPIHHALTGMRPFDASVVIDGQAGSPRDKTCALVAMLHSIGVAAQPVMVRTRPEPWIESVGCPDQMDRFLVLARLTDGTQVWCDPVEDDSSLPPGKGFYITDPPEEGETPGPVGLFDFPGRP